MFISAIARNLFRIAEIWYSQPNTSDISNDKNHIDSPDILELEYADDPQIETDIFIATVNGADLQGSGEFWIDRNSTQ